MPEKNEWLLPTQTMMWWIIHVISFISNVILFLFNSHTFIVKLYKSVTCWMCIYVYAWYELNEKWIKYGIIIFKYGDFILFGQTCDEGTCHVGTLWPGYRCVPSSQVFTAFSSNSYMCFSCKYYAGFFHTVQFHNFFIDWERGVGILLLHINICLLVLYLVFKLSCYLTCWLNTSSSWENHTRKSTASSERVAGA